MLHRVSERRLLPGAKFVRYHDGRLHPSQRLAYSSPNSYFALWQQWTRARPINILTIRQDPITKC